MSRPVQLNADARAVLLAAQLPDEDNARGFVREHDDVRSTQLHNGSKRLREARLLEASPSILLTTEGERVARRLQENEARLRDGIPFAERTAAIKMRGGKETAQVVDEWFTTEIDGRTITTNGSIIIFGKPPTENKLERSYLKQERIRAAWDEFAEGEQVSVRPVAYSEVPRWRERVRLVWFSDGSVLNADFIQFVLARYELLSWTHRPERDDRGRGYKYPLVARFKGERVAAVMTCQYDPSETIQRLIEEAQSRVVKTVEQPQPATQAEDVRPLTSAAAVQLSFLDGEQLAA